MKQNQIKFPYEKMVTSETVLLLFSLPYRTPSVNQSNYVRCKVKLNTSPLNWAIVNASLYILLAFLRKIRFFQAYINGAEVKISTVRMAQLGGQRSMDREIVGSVSVLNFIFTLGPSLTIVKSYWTHVWQVKKVTLISMIQ